MTKPYYVTLTGGKNNAGDFLIKHRAFKLFEALRPDREIIDYNEWEEIDDERLNIINGAKALILLGGPGLVYSMYPDGAYKLRRDLDDIKVPILMMGIGWKDSQGDWKDTYGYKVSSQSMKLLNRIADSGYYSSVRDYHTLSSLQFMGYNNYLMTGCPAYYDLEKIDPGTENREITKVAFSLGVSFVNSPSMRVQMKNMILFLKEFYAQKKLEVVFHHSLDPEIIQSVYGRSHLLHVQEHQKCAQWLEKNMIDYIDISGSAESLMEYYSTVDLHIGYRVHAHIFMNSISRYSILISEDGRGKAIPRVIGGIVIDGFVRHKHTLSSRILNKLFSGYDKYNANIFALKELEYNLLYEQNTGYSRLHQPKRMLQSNYDTMKKFIMQLP